MSSRCVGDLPLSRYDTESTSRQRWKEILKAHIVDLTSLTNDLLYP